MSYKLWVISFFGLQIFIKLYSTNQHKKRSNKYITDIEKEEPATWTPLLILDNRIRVTDTIQSE